MQLFLIVCLICFVYTCRAALKNSICDDEVYSVGACNALHWRIGYTVRNNKCARRSYGGCETGGTTYNTIKECEDMCKE
ncbi:kappaPI-actitoxin-Avd3b [Drosophila ficusphila]|uniref:kappaPI-actitoxin-Avd3b n=1 Tax=Drosophila ficusphila TaxID=30025 RepID=UPI0007E8A5B8|nr:kappaPI-actitoxin-Avd3b [Drosophila ficusphila]